MPISANTTSRRFLLAVTATVLAATAAVPLIATAATKKSTPKLGGTCFSTERGRRSGTLICGKSGSKYIWGRYKAPTTATTTPSNSDSAVIGGTTAAVPRPLDVIALVNGTGPTGSAIKIDVTCAGLGGGVGQATQSASFSGQGGSQTLSFNLLDPGAANPTGSTCTATGSVSGATPSVRILVDGRPSAGPATTTVSTPAFTAGGQSAVTFLVDFGTASAASAITTTTAKPLVAPSTTTPTVTVPGAPTTTLAPPSSGKPEVSTKFLGTVPTGLTGVEVSTTCTSPVPGQPFQTGTSKFGRADQTLQLTQFLAAATATTNATSCQLTAQLVGTDMGNPTLRWLLNGNAISGPNTGYLLNSPAFAAPGAFGAVIEINYAPATTTTTTIAGATTTTIAGATTTTIAGTGGTVGTTTVNLTRAGTAPANVTGYVVTLDCQNVRLGGGLFPSVSFTPIFTTAGGSSTYTLGLEPNSACVVRVATSVTAGTAAVTTGNIAVTINGASVATSTNGAAASASTSLTAPFTVGVTVVY